MSTVVEKSPIVLVHRCFVFRQDQKALFLQRSATSSHNAGQWEAPGGKLKSGQTLTEALSSEVWEETGLLIETVSNLSFTSSRLIIDGGKYHNHTYVAIFSVAKLTGGELKLSSEHQQARWLYPEKDSDLALTRETRQAVKALAIHLS